MQKPKLLQAMRAHLHLVCEQVIRHAEAAMQRNGGHADAQRCEQHGAHAAATACAAHLSMAGMSRALEVSVRDSMPHCCCRPRAADKHRQGHLVRKKITMPLMMEMPMNFSRSLQAQQAACVSCGSLEPEGEAWEVCGRSAEVRRAPHVKVRPAMTMGDCRTMNRYTQAIARKARAMREVGLSTSVMSVTDSITIR